MPAMTDEEMQIVHLQDQAEMTLREFTDDIIRISKEGPKSDRDRKITKMVMLGVAAKLMLVRHNADKTGGAA